MLPLRVGILVALVASVAYEPLRWLTTMLSPSLDEALGGVGGVGGLANLGSPTANCSTTTGGARAPYCFYPGLVFGLTPFALVVLAVWVLPLALGALAATARKCAATLAPTASTATASRSLCGAWVLMNVAWFALPLAQYCVRRTGLEPQPSRLKIDLPLSRASPALDSSSTRSSTARSGAASSPPRSQPPTH